MTVDYAHIEYLTSPAAEAMPDGERLTELVNQTRQLLDWHNKRTSELLAVANKEVEIRRSAIRRLGRVHEAVMALYSAAYWTADRETDEQALWTEVRDAAEIPPGTSPRRMAGETSFRQAVIDELVVWHIYTREHDLDARKAVRDIVNWNVEAALDPKISEGAAALLAQTPDSPVVTVD